MILVNVTVLSGRAKECKQGNRVSFWPLCNAMATILTFTHGSRVIVSSDCFGIYRLLRIFFTLPETPAGYCILLVSSFFLSFFLLATLLRLIASTCFDRFQPDLVIRTPDTWHLCHMTTVGLKVMWGSQGPKS